MQEPLAPSSNQIWPPEQLWERALGGVLTELRQESVCLERLFTQLIQVIKRNPVPEATFFIFGYVTCSQRGGNFV